MIEVSNADRVVYPDDGFTKGDVVAHYGRVADAMLPHVQGRPLTLVRHPKGIAKKGFFQKSAGKHFPDFIARIAVPKSDGVNQHASVSNADGLCYLANQGTIELHTTLTKLPDLSTPDRLVLDLDPPAGDASVVRRAARQTRALLDELDLASTPLASGGKGYHVYVALDANVTGQRVGEIAHTLAEILARRHADSLTTEILKKNRKGRVLVDWMRNFFASTVIAPFSLRARKGAPVAVPITWDELEDTPPNHYTLKTIEARLDAPDPLLALTEAPSAAEALVERCAALRAELGIELVRFDRFGRER